MMKKLPPNTTALPHNLTSEPPPLPLPPLDEQLCRRPPTPLQCQRTRSLVPPPALNLADLAVHLPTRRHHSHRRWRPRRHRGQHHEDNPPARISRSDFLWICAIFMCGTFSIVQAAYLIFTLLSPVFAHPLIPGTQEQLFETLPTALAQVRASGSTRTPLQAYDCSQPEYVRDVTHTQMALECHSPRNVASTRNVTYQILVKEKQTDIKGFSCSAVHKRTVSYCGNYDHQTELNQFAFHGLPYRITAAACREMRRTQKFVDPMGISHPVQIGGTAMVFYQSTGRSYTADGEGKCTGAQVVLGNQRIDSAIVDNWLHITIQDERIIHQNGNTIAYGPQVRLPCAFPLGQCETPKAAYIWTPPTDHCALRRSVETSGIEATDSNAETVFMSSDGNNIRLVLTGKVQYCGRVVYTTNYDSLFAYDVVGKRRFTTDISPSDIRMSTYVNSRDDHLYHSIAEQINNEVGHVLTEYCAQQAKQERLRFFMQYATPGLTSYYLGNGTFATSAGEVLYYYQCRQRTVQAVEAARCYDALPIRVLAEHEDQHSTPTEQDEQPSLFMTPLTHQMTRHAVPVPCSTTFEPKYRTISGAWIKATPKLHLTVPPLQPFSTFHRPVHLDQTLDYSRGGVYPKDELDRMETMLEMPRLRDELTFRLSNQVQMAGDTSSITSSQMFPDIPTINPWSKLSTVMWSFIHTWGDVASILVTAYTGYAGICAIARCLTGGIYGKKQGCNWRLLVACLCPSLWLMRAAAQPQEPKEEHQPLADWPENDAGTSPSTSIIRAKMPSYMADPQPTTKSTTDLTPKMERNTPARASLPLARRNSFSPSEATILEQNPTNPF